MLDLAGVSVEPPRASQSVVPLRVRAFASRAVFEAAYALTVADGAFRRQFNPDVNWPALVRGIVPGWGHRSLGQRAFGAIIAAVWLLLLLWAALLAGGPGFWPVYAMLVGWHCLSINLIMARPLGQQPVLRRAAIGFLVFALVNFCLYLPAGFMLSRIAVPLHATGIKSVASLQDDDTLLYTGAWTSPERYTRGQIVAYHIAGRALQPGVLIADGMGVDRIIATPNDLVSSDGNSVFVNGEPAPSPSLGVAILPSFTTRLSANEYFIYPSLLRMEAYGMVRPSDLASQLSVVRADSIRGKVFWRLRPWSRMGRLQATAPTASQPLSLSQPILEHNR